MNEIYVEQMVHKDNKNIFAVRFMIVAVSFAPVLLTVLMRNILAFIVIAVIAFIVDVHLWNKLYKDYEYYLIMGRLFIDVIFNKKSRERLVSLNCDDILSLKHIEDGSDPKREKKALDASSSLFSKNRWAVKYRRGDKEGSFIFEPNEKILSELKKCIK